MPTGIYPRKPMSEETKIKLSQSKKGNTNCLGYKHSEESKLKTRLSMLGKNIGKNTGEINPAKRPEIRELLRKQKLGNNNPAKRKEVREKISKSVSKLYNNPDYLKKIEIKKSHNSWRGYFKSYKNNKELYFQSSLELLTYINLECNIDIINFNRCYFSIKYFYENKERKYIPDIIVTFKNNKKEIIEIKPTWQLKTPRNLIKFKSAKKYCKKEKIAFKILTEKEIGWFIHRSEAWQTT